MKFSIIDHNKLGHSVDGYTNETWVRGLKNIIEYTPNHEEADFSLLFLFYPGEKYEYNHDLDKVKFNNIIIVDYMEFDWDILYNKDYKNCYSIYGYNHTLDVIKPGFWERDRVLFCKKIHDKIQNVLKPYIRLYFKREMSSYLDYTNIGVDVLPCDYLNYLKDFEILNKDDFYNKKTVDLLYIWGRSSQDRVKMHATFMLEMDRWGHNMYFSEKQFENIHLKNNNSRAIVTIQGEWFERINYMYYQNFSQCVLDMYGAGMKCFRNIESSFGAVSIKQDPSVLIHKYPWIDGVNCVTLPTKEDNRIDIHNSFNKIWEYIRGDKRDDLYNIYLNSIETGRKYETMTYITNYLLPEIKCRLV